MRSGTHYHKQIPNTRGRSVSDTTQKKTGDDQISKIIVIFHVQNRIVIARGLTIKYNNSTIPPATKQSSANTTTKMSVYANTEISAHSHTQKRKSSSPSSIQTTKNTTTSSTTTKQCGVHTRKSISIFMQS